MFEDAYKSPLSVILLDELECILEYAAVGPHFSNVILQTLLVLLKRQPPAGRRLLVIGTTSNLQVMEMLELSAAFNVTLHVPQLKSEDTKRVLTHVGAFAPEEVRDRVYVSRTAQHRTLVIPTRSSLSQCPDNPDVT